MLGLIIGLEEKRSMSVLVLFQIFLKYICFSEHLNSITACLFVSNHIGKVTLITEILCVTHLTFLR